jgi:hypothetical protein
MKIIFALLLASLSVTDFSITPAQHITLGNNRAIDCMYVFEKNNENHLAIFSPGGDDKTLLYVVDSHGRTIHTSDTLYAFLHDRNTCIKDGELFYFDDKLHCIDLAKFTTTSFKMQNCEYQRIIAGELEGRKIVVASNRKFIDVIDLAGNRIQCRINRSGAVRFGEIKYWDGNVIYNTKENELAVFNIQSNKNLWTYSFGMMKGKLLGITLGTFENWLCHFAIAEAQKEIYTTDAAGDLCRFDLATGTIKVKVEHFSGSSNNAGLIPTFSLFDMNHDGVMDIVAPSVDHNVYLINGKDLTVSWQYDTDNENQRPVSLYDITGDGIPEVFNLNDYDRMISVVNGKTGEKVTERKLPKTKWLIQSSVCLADFNGDGKLDLIVRDNGIEIGVFEMSEVSVAKNAILSNPYFGR